MIKILEKKRNPRCWTYGVVHEMGDYKILIYTGYLGTRYKLLVDKIEEPAVINIVGRRKLIEFSNINTEFLYHLEELILTEI